MESVDSRFVKRHFEPALDGDERMIRILMDVAGKLDKLADEHEQTRELIGNHIKGEEHLLGLFKKAFPGDDPEGHRRYHETLIDEAIKRREFWQKMLFELSKFGLIGFVGWALVQLWTGALKGPQ